jgi:hypothetical protein
VYYCKYRILVHILVCTFVFYHVFSFILVLSSRTDFMSRRDIRVDNDSPAANTRTVRDREYRRDARGRSDRSSTSEKPRVRSTLHIEGAAQALPEAEETDPVRLTWRQKQIDMGTFLLSVRS